jgi:hypothetical protein
MPVGLLVTWSPSLLHQRQYLSYLLTLVNRFKTDVLLPTTQVPK